MEMGSSQVSLVTTSSFLTLAVLRGSTPLMAYLAVSSLKSSGLVVALKSAISFVCFTVTLLVLYFTDGEMRMQIMINLKSTDTYWKLPLIGLLQAAAPYLLVVYSMAYLPPTLLGVFMTATPWFTIILERLPCVKIKSTVNSYVKIGIFIGLPAIILIMSPILHESLINCSMVKESNQTSQKYPLVYDICLKPVELLQGTLALIFGALLWAISSVVWRSLRGNIHYVVSSVGQNLTALVIGLTCWALFDLESKIPSSIWNEVRTIVGLACLGIGTGYVATILVHYLSKNIGAKPTNQVLVFIPIIAFIEDCLIVKSVVTVHPWLIGLEVLGILMLSVAAFLTNLSGTKADYSNSLLSEHLIQTDNCSQIDGDYQNMQNEIGKYQALSSESDEDSSAKEEEVPILSGESNYPPLREIVGDDLNKTSTLKL